MLAPLTKKEGLLARERPKARAARRYLSRCSIAGELAGEPDPRKVADDMGRGFFRALSLGLPLAAGAWALIIWLLLWLGQ